MNPIIETPPPGLQLHLFDERLPKRPYCTDDLEAGLLIRPSATAARKKYLQVNQPWARAFMVFDLDHERAAYQWDDAGLPPPYWNALNPDNGRGHTCYALDAPVLLGDMAKAPPMRYLAAVESAMTAALQADSSYSGLITKNPKHKHWRTLTGGEAYDLDFLADHLDLAKHTPKRGQAVECGVGRNVETFDATRKYAYSAIRKFWQERNFILWQAHLQDRAMIFSQGAHSSPLDHKECHHLAKSIAKWTWANFSAAGLSEWQRPKGRASGRVRLRKAQRRDERVLELRRAGRTVKEVADELNVSPKSIKRALERASEAPNVIPIARPAKPRPTERGETRRQRRLRLALAQGRIEASPVDRLREVLARKRAEIARTQRTEPDVAEVIKRAKSPAELALECANEKLSQGGHEPYQIEAPEPAPSAEGQVGSRRGVRGEADAFKRMLATIEANRWKVAKE